MPFSIPSIPARPAIAGRTVVISMAAIIAMGTILTGAAPTEAADLTGVISANRNNQIATESAMRAADRRIKSLKRDAKVTRRKLKRTDRKIATKTRKRNAARARLEGTEKELTLALTGELPPYSPPQIEPAPTELDVEGPRLLATPGLGMIVVEEPESALSSDQTVKAPPIVRLAATPAEIRALRVKVGKHSKAFVKSKVRLRKAERAKRMKMRHSRSIRRQRRVSIAQRERYERALGSWIKSMTRLSKLRAAKKYKVRPGVGGSRFIRPSNGSLSQGYHAGHDGLDIVSYRGAPIRASARGVVAYVGWNPWDKGKRAFVVVLGHASGYETIYGHLLPIRRVRVGEEIRKGQIIGNMGSTGHSTGTHVHWEVSRNWRTLNPASVL